jgi:hypothetical protein
MIEMERDSRGRFTGEKFSPELRAKWAEDDRRAELAAQIMDRLRLPKDQVGLRQKLAQAGEGWQMSEKTRGVLLGAAFGIAYASSRADKDLAPMLVDLVDALGMRERFLGFVEKYA